MIFPATGAAIVTTIAATTAATAARIVARGGGIPANAKCETGLPRGEWEGVQCCPRCREPISEKEKWSGCCSMCGHTEYAYIHTKTRARRRVVGDDGTERWEYKDQAVAQPSSHGWLLFIGLIFIPTVVIIAHIFLR